MSNLNPCQSSKPGKTGVPLHESNDVIRMGLEQSHYDEVGANQFELSSKEKKEAWKRISVWETSLTKVEDLVKILSPKRSLVIMLNVGKVRSLRFEEDISLDIKWDNLPECIDKNGKKQKGYFSGCEGHCALDGLYPSDKELRKRIRKKLADLASDSEFYALS